MTIKNTDQRVNQQVYGESFERIFSKKKKCTKCKGSGDINSEKCPKCDGTGKV